MEVVICCCRQRTHAPSPQWAQQISLRWTCFVQVSRQMEHTGPWDLAVEATEAALVVFLEDIFMDLLKNYTIGFVYTWGARTDSIF